MVSWSWKMKENLFGSYEYAKISIIFTNFVSKDFYFTKSASHLRKCWHVFFETDKDDTKMRYNFSSHVKCIINICQLFYADINCSK